MVNKQMIDILIWKFGYFSGYKYWIKAYWSVKKFYLIRTNIYTKIFKIFM